MKIKNLKNRNGERFFPVTSTKAVLNDSGIDIDTLLDNKVSKVHGKGLSTNDYTDADKAALLAKQEALTNSEDVTVSGSRLSVTERAKRAIFIDLYNARCIVASSNKGDTIRRNTFGRYNEETGYFELNGLTDITYGQAVEIIRVPAVAAVEGNNTALEFSRARTLFPIVMDFGGSLYGICSYMPNLEVVRFVNYYIVNNGADPDTTPMMVCSTRGAFAQCPSLREVKGVLWLQSNDDMKVHFYSALDRSANLETIWLQGVCLNISLTVCAALRYECIAYMVEHAANTDPITITLHPDAYARVTEDLFALAAEKQITIATA